MGTENVRVSIEKHFSIHNNRYVLYPIYTRTYAQHIQRVHYGELFKNNLDVGGCRQQFGCGYKYSAL